MLTIPETSSIGWSSHCTTNMKSRPQQRYPWNTRLLTTLRRFELKSLAELFFTRFSSLKLYVIPFTLLPFNTNSLNQGRLNRTSIYQFSFNGTRVTSIITIHLRGPFVYSLVIWVNILLNLLRVFTNNSNCQKQCLEFYRNSCNLWNFVIMLIKLDKIFLGLLLRASLR